MVIVTGGVECGVTDGVECGVTDGVVFGMEVVLDEQSGSVTMERDPATATKLKGWRRGNWKYRKLFMHIALNLL